MTFSIVHAIPSSRSRPAKEKHVPFLSVKQPGGGIDTDKRCQDTIDYRVCCARHSPFILTLVSQPALRTHVKYMCACDCELFFSPFRVRVHRRHAERTDTRIYVYRVYTRAEGEKYNGEKTRGEEKKGKWFDCLFKMKRAPALARNSGRFVFNAAVKRGIIS